MRAKCLLLLLFAPLSLEAAEVSLQIHSELNGFDYESKPLPQSAWNSDGTYSVWQLRLNTGAGKIIETGARAVVKGTSLLLCFAVNPTKYAPNQPMPLVAFPVVLEFRVSGLARGEYVVKDVSACK
jgi:hypothetical protein